MPLGSRSARHTVLWYHMRMKSEEKPDSRPPTDYRSMRRKMDTTLARAVIIFLVGVGGTLIALIFGRGPAVGGLLCLSAGAGVFGLIWMILTLMGRWAGED